MAKTIISLMKDLTDILEDNENVSETLFVMYNDDNELECELMTESQIIDYANDQEPVDVEPIEDIDTAIQSIVDFNNSIHIMELV